MPLRAHAASNFHRNCACSFTSGTIESIGHGALRFIVVFLGNDIAIVEIQLIGWQSTNERTKAKMGETELGILAAAMLYRRADGGRQPNNATVFLSPRWGLW